MSLLKSASIKISEENYDCLSDDEKEQILD